MSEQVPAAERLLDLVIALTHTNHRMTKADIRARVNGYGAANDRTFERMFERDKTALREAGIPLVTVVDDAHGDDIGYRIDLDGYTMPELGLTPEEIGILSVAAQVWQGADLDARARRGLVKLNAVAPGASADLAGHVLRVPPPEASFDALLEAVHRRRLVTFDYRAASSGTTSRRRVEPWRLLVREGAWYLQAWDTARDAERQFRLSRVVGAVTVKDEPARHDVGEPPLDAGEAGVATLLVRPGRGASLRVRARSVEAGTGHDEGWDVLQLPVGDLEDLAGLVAGHTDAVLVREPERLRAAVVARLRAVAMLDGEPAPGSAARAGAAAVTPAPDGEPAPGSAAPASAASGAGGTRG